MKNHLSRRILSLVLALTMILSSAFLIYAESTDTEPTTASQEEVESGENAEEAETTEEVDTDITDAEQETEAGEDEEDAEANVDADADIPDAEQEAEAGENEEDAETPEKAEEPKAAVKAAGAGSLRAAGDTSGSSIMLTWGANSDQNTYINFVKLTGEHAQDGVFNATSAGPFTDPDSCAPLEVKFQNNDEYVIGTNVAAPDARTNNPGDRPVWFNNVNTLYPNGRNANPDWYNDWINNIPTSRFSSADENYIYSGTFIEPMPIFAFHTLLLSALLLPAARPRFLMNAD